MGKYTKTTNHGSKKGNTKLRIAFLLILSIILFSSVGMVTTSASLTTNFESAFCSGTNGYGGQYGGIIPTSNVLAGHSTGEQSLLTMSILIMFVLFVAGAIIYMIGYAFHMENLKNLAKSEFGEILVTAIIVFVFIGGFDLATIGTNPSLVFHAAGSNFGRKTYIDDCMYMTGTSMGLILPLFVAGKVQWLMGLVESFGVNLAPAYFGVSFSPFTGYMLFNQVFSILTVFGWGMVGMILAIIMLLGLIFALFPLFLYVGIVLRSLPWTRAAGGAFLGLFVGFYIIFPLLLHVMLGGYVSQLTSYSLNNNQIVSNAGIASGLVSQSKQGASGFTNYVLTLWDELKYVYDIASSGDFGIFNGFILFVIEPAAFTVFTIAFALIISFDFSEVAGRLLGAPSLSAGMMVGRLKGLA